MDNPYAPPKARVEDIQTPPIGGSTDSSPPFFPVSLLKFVVLSICTLNIYELYWFFKNWQLVRQRERTDISPFWRAFFSLFFCYAFFRRVRDYSSPASGARPIPAGALAIGWILMRLTWKLPGPYSLMGDLAIVFLVPVQAAAARVNAMAAPQHDRNSRFSAWNWVAIVVGGIVLALVVAGSFVKAG